MCESLAEAHAKGLVHRDIKPANVYVCHLGGRFDVVKVLDFGLVKRDITRVAGEARLTVADVAMGTPAYLPPEMARGGEVDARTDIYAVGCVGYWLATGTLVFEGKSPLEVVSQHMRDTPEAPSKRVELTIPQEFDELILACLAKDPGDRPANARDLARRLRTIPAGAAWTDSMAAGWWEQHLPDALRDEAAATAFTTARSVAP
jgi:serine/threonine-protein kinase